MEILLLDNDPAKNAQYPDDKSLDKQIKAIAQTLCAVHYNICTPEDCVHWEEDVGFNLYKLQSQSKYVNWASECRSNYEQLVKMGLACCCEYNYRFEERKHDELTKEIVHIKINEHKLRHVIEWTHDNVPNLPDNCAKTEECFCKKSEKCQQPEPTQFPLVMHYRYYQYEDELGSPKFSIINSYRNYYRAKLPKDAKWSRREKPEFLR